MQHNEINERERLLLRALIMARNFSRQFSMEYGEDSFKDYFERVFKTYRTLVCLVLVLFISGCATKCHPLKWEDQSWDCHTDQECVEECLGRGFDYDQCEF